ncbi:MAG: ArsR family transcriptional regulator, arsenate/arsenite/antimonite-responsive transcriptional [Thermoplasmata archaeon]|jgi:DNA-binding transcriptional ArsR family regulator|nr:ArsR family transcriptional regulator, arsenate/arsenite/antimonite-responsive transcriptional [Thermoplasmata archaeon]
MSSEPLPGPEDIPLDPDLLRTLASDSRRDILRLLKQRRMTLTELATALNLGKATVLEHLKKLQDTQLVARRDDERLWVYYELTPRGKRVVTPGRTRFFLVMGLTAAAALLLGVVLALAFTHASAPARDLGSKSLGEPALLQAQGSEVVWRQLSENATLAVSEGGRPVHGTLFVDAQPLATDERGTVTLDAAALDALPAGNHSLSFLRATGNAREPVGGFLDVRQPRLAVTPLQVPVGRDTAVALSFADPATPLDPSSRVLHPATPGPVPVQVGRLDPIQVEAVPDYALAFASDRSGNLTLTAKEAAGARVSLDGALLGTLDANGTLRFPAPSDGLHALLVEGPAGAMARSILTRGGDVSEAPVAISLQAAGPQAATLRNEGPGHATLTLDTLADGRVVASREIEVPANATLPLSPDTAGAAPGAHAIALELRAPPLTPIAGTNATSTAGSPAPRETSDSASTSTSTYGVHDDGIVARLALGSFAVAPPVAASPAAGVVASPQTPGAGVALLVAAALVAAVLTSRRRR